MPALELLDVGGNQFNGTVPSELSNLSTLIALYLDDNAFTGTPPDVSASTGMVLLDLSHNSYDGSLPSWLTSMTQLVTIDLSFNDFTGPVPAALGDLNMLQWLDLTGNHFDGSIPAELGGLGAAGLQAASAPSSSHLRFDQIARTGGESMLNALALTDLTTLNLGSNMFSGEIPNTLMDLTGLTDLDLSYNMLETSDPDLNTFLVGLSPDWADTQTISPSNVQVENVASDSVTLSWTPISYVGDGGYYQVMYGTTDGGPYDQSGCQTTDKTETGCTVSGLDTAGTTYYFVVQTFTPAHGDQSNDLTSASSSQRSNAFLGCTSPGNMAQSECEALVALYNSANGASWIDNSGWMTTTPCTWYGVTCGGSVTTLNLSSNNLNGTIPTEIGNLTSLVTLDLRSNSLSGGIPTEIGSLSLLQKLDLRNNSLSGSIPTSIDGMSSLRSLYLVGNNLDGNIPTQLGGLSNLRTLSLRRNRLVGSIPSEIGSLLNLKSLELDANALAGEIPTTITNLTGLTSMNLSYNMLESSDANVLSYLSTFDPDWADTQNVAPTNLQVDSTGSDSVDLSWTPIIYTGDGGYYEVMYGTSSGGPYDQSGCQTADKTATGCTVNSLGGATYYFVVRTITPAHGAQMNDLTSGGSTEVSAAISGAFSTCAAVSSITETECDGLVALYNSTGGASWTDNTGWLSDPDPCTWFGVTCTGGHVTSQSLT